MLQMLRLTVKLFPKQKILDKPLLNRGNKRKKPKNLKNKIIAKIEVGAIYLQTKIALLPIGPSKNNTAPTKHTVDFHTFLRDGISLLVEKESG